jgi:hypothetical protein
LVCQLRCKVGHGWVRQFGDCRQAQGAMQQFFSSFLQFFREFGLRRLGALAILAFGTVPVVFGIGGERWCARPSDSVRVVVDTNADLAPTANFEAAASAASTGASASGAQSFDDGGVPRPLYPYSVVPGGVRSATEVRIAEAQDAAVRAHYAGINLATLHAAQLNQAKLVYVSYRRGNRIFWTKSALRLAKGEEVMTDGAIMLRARCGNRISEVPMAPVESPEAVVVPAAMELPEAAGIPLPLAAAPLDVPLAPVPSTTIEVPPAPPILWAGGPGVYIPPFYIVPTGSGPVTPTQPAGPGTPSGPSGTGPGSPSGPTGPGGPAGPGLPSTPSGPAAPGQPPIATPEPGELAMLIAGLGAVFTLLRKKRAA